MVQLRADPNQFPAFGTTQTYADNSDQLPNFWLFYRVPTAAQMRRIPQNIRAKSLMQTLGTWAKSGPVAGRAPAES
ncbi:MAG: hypothetical protein EOO63_18490 [Hymenobacter sp.]|nr:MAG: hypothetical protein EOO63_18490 [Hymenobacter sp.]